MDIYDKSRTFMEEIIKENEHKIDVLLGKQEELHFKFNIPIKRVPEGLEKIIPWIKEDETVRYCCYCVDFFKENGIIKYKIEKSNKGHSASAINVITKHSIEVDNSDMPSKNKVESDLKCIMDSVNETIPKYLSTLYIKMQGGINE